MYIIAIILSLAAVTFQSDAFSDSYYELYHSPSTVECPPQKTPLYGKKWCNFTKSPNEIGAVCYFSCIEGYFLTQTKVNKCVEKYVGAVALFNSTVGRCLPRSRALKYGRNGPFTMRSRYNSTHWDVDNQNRLMVVPTLSKFEFYITEPGLDLKSDTVSFVSKKSPNHYIAMKGNELLLLSKESASQINGSFEDACSFILYEDKFFEGYTAFESYLNDGSFISVSNGKLKMAMPHTVISKALSSFTWLSV